MNWLQKIDEINVHRDVIRAEAEDACKKMGHTMFPWTCMNSTLCRKCGMTVYLHNIHGTTDSRDITGRAIDQRCDVNFDGKHEFSEFKHQDYNGKTVI